MEAHALSTELRQETGKNAARRLRAKGLIPAVYYARGVEPVGLAVSPKELAAALSTSHRRNKLFKISVNGEDKFVVVQDLQIHPVTRQPLHVDFCGMDPSQPVDRMVPLTTTGRAAGVVAGGELRVLFRSLPVRATMDIFPDVINLDVSKLNLGDSITVQDIQLAEGVSVQMPAERNVVTVAVSRRRAAVSGEEAQAS
jgi:large subunit ribosomal protein L25